MTGERYGEQDAWVEKLLRARQELSSRSEEHQIAEERADKLREVAREAARRRVAADQAFNGLVREFGDWLQRQT